MRTTLLAAGATLAMLSATTSAQAPAPAAPPVTCYIEVKRLMADAPQGIGDLGAAIRELDQQLRPQVEAIKVLKAQIARLERQAESAARPGIEQASLDFGDTALAPPVRDDAAAEEVMRLQMELDGKQDALKRDYADRQQALVGPVQARINQSAHVFATNNGCADMKMARTADLETLAGSGARDMTDAFVAWYLANPPA